MNRADFSGNLRDYNGDGKWSVGSVQQRYREYCIAFRVDTPRVLSPREYAEGDIQWVYPIMDEVIQGIEEGDAACVALGVDFIEEDVRFPFGRRLKSNTARALRRSRLTDPQMARVRERVSTMLAAGIVPYEMREYVKLLRTVGVGDFWPLLENSVPRDNPHAMRFYRSLRAADGLPD
jgi:hypothetical protein